jgi:putative ABC transport system permease protein
MRVPLSYNLRSLLVRRSATLLTVIGIGATVTVLAGVLSLRQGFTTLFAEAGREDVALFLRPGSTSEGDSIWRRDKADRLIKTLPEIARDETGRPRASMECYLAVRRFRVGGGETNVPVRGVQPMSLEIHGDGVSIAEGRPFRPGADEVIVGRKLVDRIRDCRLGDVIQLNTSPLRVVGIFDSDGPFASEIWGDLDRMLEALNRPSPSRVIAHLAPGVDVAALDERLRADKELPAKVMTERAYLVSQTGVLATTLEFLGMFLGVVMGIAAVFTATNTMLSAIAARTHEIGILLAAGFRPFSIFLSFLFEALVLGLLGGAAGCLMALPLNGVETGATNFNTFTEVAFAFRVTPDVLITAVVFALALGLLGGAVPAWKAARLEPVEALRRK